MAKVRQKLPSLDEFYAAITTRLRRERVPCAITGGLACVEFGITEHTEDCDLICSPARAAQLLEVLHASPFGPFACRYRGSISAPLDARWLRGGYSAHFQWPATSSLKPFLDVFGSPPRVSSPWEKEIVGRFAGRHTVAEMKRTDRRKDWDQATALGLQMLEAGDSKGWLHIFDAGALRALARNQSPPRSERRQRPVLQLAVENSPLLDRGVQTEIDFWMNLNRRRLQIYQDNVAAYGRAVRQDTAAKNGDLLVQHRARVLHAERLLPRRPLQDYGVERLISEARQATAIGLDPAILKYLPSAARHFKNVSNKI